MSLGWVTFVKRMGLNGGVKFGIKSHIKISQGYINHKKDPPNQGNASSVKMLIHVQPSM